MNQATLSFPATHLTTEQIGRLASLRREKLGFSRMDMALSVDLLKAMEYADDLSLKILPNDHPELAHAYAVARTDLSPPEIWMRDSTYLAASNAEAEGIFTIAHELGHIDCRHPLQPPSRMIPHFRLEPERSGEWQAEVYAYWLLAPPTLVAAVGYTTDDLIRWFGLPSAKADAYCLMMANADDFQRYRS